MAAADGTELPEAVDEVRFNRRPSLVRLAILARFEYFDTTEGGARARVATALGVKPATLSHQIQQDDQLRRIALATEAARVAPSHVLSRLARRLLTSSAIERFELHMPPHWWPQLERAVLDPSGRLRPRAPVEVLGAAECFIAHHAPTRRPDLLADRPAGEERPWAGLDDQQRHDACELIRWLCALTAGPYQAASEARDLLALLVPAAPELVMGFADGAPNGQSVLLPLERAVRIYRADLALRDAVSGWLLAKDRSTTPPSSALILLRTLCRRTPGPDGSELRRLLTDYTTGLVDQSSTVATIKRRAALWIAWEMGMELDAEAQLGDVLSAARAARADLGSVDDFVEWEGFLNHVGDGPAGAGEILAAVQQIDRRRPASRRGHWSVASPSVQEAARRLLAELLVTPCLIRRRTTMDVLEACGPAVAGPVGIEAARVLVDAAGEHGLEHVADRAAYVAGAMRDMRALGPVISVAMDETVALPVRRSAILAIGHIVHRNQQHPDVGSGLDALAALVDREQGPVVPSVVQAMAVVRRTRFERHFEDPPVRWSEDTKAVAAWGKELLDDPLLPPVLP
jgi:hypothetical protein